ncbi:hypothetical protein D3C72_1438310 [compost metagenome]
MVARVIQKPGIAQMVVRVADQKVEDQPAPQLMDIGNRIGAVLQQDVHQFRICLSRVAAIRLQHRRGRHVGYTAAISGAVEPPNDGDCRFIDQLHARRSRADARLGRKLHSEHLAANHVALVRLAGKFSQGQTAIGISNGRLGPGPAQRGALPKQILQVLRALSAGL